MQPSRKYRLIILISVVLAILLLGLAMARYNSTPNEQIVLPTKTRDQELSEQLSPKKQVELDTSIKTATIGEVEREYIISKPKNVSVQRILIALHGGEGSAKQLKTTLKLDEEVSSDTAIIYLNSVDGNWKDQRFQDPVGQANDIDFITTITKETQKEFGISPEKTVLLGVSNGGIMSQTLVCKDATLFHTTVLVSAPILSEIAESCSQLSPNTTLILGTNDTITPYKGGEIQSPQGGEVLSGVKSTEFLAKTMKCTEENNEKEEKDNITQKYPSCSNSGTLTVISKIGDTHISTLLRTKIDQGILQI